MSVEGETSVSPLSIVNLNFQVRYVYPTTPSSGPNPNVKKELPNGESHPLVNGDTATTTAVQQAVNAVGQEEKDIKEGGNTDVKDKVGDLKEKIADVVEEKPAGDGGSSKKGDEKEKVWEKNGHAHAPFWPQVSRSRRMQRGTSAKHTAAQTPLLGATRRLEAR